MAVPNELGIRRQQAVDYFMKKLDITCSVDALSSDVKLLNLSESLDRMFLDFNKSNMNTGGSISI